MTPTIITAGSHKCAEICKVLRHYLKHEWDERANNDQHPGSVPRIWAKRWEEAKNLKTVTAVPTIEWEDLPDISLNGRLPKQVCGPHWKGKKADRSCICASSVVL